MAKHATRTDIEWIDDSDVRTLDVIRVENNNNKVNNIKYLQQLVSYGVAGNCYSNDTVVIDPDGWQYFEVTNRSFLGGNSIVLVDPEQYKGTNVNSTWTNDLFNRWCNIWGVMGWLDHPGNDMPGQEAEHRIKFIRYYESDSPVVEATDGYVWGAFFTGSGERTWDITQISNPDHVLYLKDDGDIDLYFYVDSDDGQFKMYWDHAYGSEIEPSYSFVFEFGPKWTV